MKRLVLLTVILLLAIPASAQVAFQVTSLPRQVRGEGVAETVGDVLLTAINAGTITTGSTINIVYAATVNAAGTTTTAGDNVMVAQGGFVIPVTMTSALNATQITVSFTAATTFAMGQGFSVSNIRVDASGFSSGGQITAFISGVSANPGTNPITFTQPAVTIGLVTKPSMTATGVATPFTTLLTCAGGGPTTAVTAKVTEVFPSAFTSQFDERAFTTAIPPASITNGTLIQVTVSGVPSGVAVVLTPSVFKTGGSVLSGTTAVISKTAATSTANIATILAAGGSATTGTSAAGADQIFTIAFTGATQTSQTEDLSIAFVATMAAPIAALATPPTITASIAVLPAISGAITRFAATSLLSSTTVGAVGNCTSVLMFPYIAANVASFDTSIAIVNTTKDSFLATVTATPQPGACTITGFPSTWTTDATTGAITAVTTGTAVTLTTVSIPAGGTWAASLGSTTAFSGFVGYAFATCNFLNAHGFAFISNGFGGIVSISHGYLPLILNPNLSRVVAAGESLNN